MQLQPNYIVDSDNHRIAVQLDIDTYNTITNTLEDYGLFKLMEENNNSEKLSLKDAKEYYKSLKESDAN